MTLNFILLGGVMVNDGWFKKQTPQLIQLFKMVSYGPITEKNWREFPPIT